ncbi:CPSF A subunit region [Phlyctema vagabunda]|uniref:CPSF A subunit region n=1 Tax=Phlyctema vagabunda TaxID=108571 RepID=A0ABR4PV42_9HELO
MAYLAPIHRPSSVRHALKLSLLDREEECLVLAKANRLEIWTGTEEGLVMVHSKSIYGRVTMLQKIRPPGATTDHLFVGTARFQYFTVAWNAATQQLETMQAFVDVAERYLHDSQSRDRCIVDPTGQHMVMELFEGVLNLVKIRKPRKGKEDYLEQSDQVRITELHVRASTFLYTPSNRPKMAMLYHEGKDRTVKLVTYRVVDEKGQFINFDPAREREDYVTDLDMGADHLIPVSQGEEENKRYIVRNQAAAKAQLGGVIVVGETKMLYLDDESKATVQVALPEASIFVAWETYDNLHYLLADDYGMLWVLEMLIEGAVVTGMDVRKIGKTSKASELVYMGNGILFVASHEGDSQVVRVDIAGAQIEVLQTMTNVAPILDFAVMDMGSRDGESLSNEYSSGQARIVTGSNTFESGSLRSMRSGVGLEDIGILADMADIRSLFALRSSSNSVASDTLVVSLLTETRIFRFDSQGEIEEVDSFGGLLQNCETILAANIGDGLILQITRESVMILGPGPVSLISRWKPPTGQIITAASANEGFILLSADGRTLVTLDICKGLAEVATQNLGNEDQVACVHIPPRIDGIAIVGFWKSGSISILDLQTLEVLHSESLRKTDNASVPRDIALTQILPAERSGPTLFVAMEDGIVHTFNVDRTTHALSGRKSIVLGTQQAQLQILDRKNGLFNVFATCEHPSLIYGAEGRIVYSAVTADNATSVCSFDSEAYPDSIIVATSESLKISRIDTERRTHVRKLHVGETVRRIVYSAPERAFGLGTINRTLMNNAEVITSSFRLVDEVMFGELGKPFVLSDLDPSVGMEIIESIARAELPVAGGDLAERFLVGTSYELDEDAPDNNIRGRILVFGIDSDRNPFLVTSHRLKGACRCLSMLNGKILAALTKTVVMYDYEEITPTEARLIKAATYRTSTSPIDLDVSGNLITVADMMKSVSLLEYLPGSNGLPDKLVEVARHEQASWSTAVVQIAEGSYLQSDHDGNLIILQRNPDGVTAQDRRRLDVTSEMSLGEQVNKIRSINVETSPNAIAVPKAFLATTEGSIYLLALLAPSLQDLLMRMQTRMAGLVPTPGDMDFPAYRGFKNEGREAAEPFRFVDGELIERFLDLDEPLQDRVAEGLGMVVEDLRNLVEELKRLH